MAYVYRHIRLDNNVPFYIGIGSDDNYSRANFKHNRNKHWNNIVSKSEYEVEILLDDLTWDDAKLKEIEFISIYKRNDTCGGPLVNKTDGGDGCLGLIHTEESRVKMSIPNRGKKLSEKHIESLRWHGKNMSLDVRKKISNSLKGRVPWNIGIKNKKHSELMKDKMIGEENPYSKLTEKDVLKIRDLYSKGNISHIKIAAIFNVSRNCISNVISRKTWKFI